MEIDVFIIVSYIVCSSAKDFLKKKKVGTLLLHNFSELNCIISCSFSACFFFLKAKIVEILSSRKVNTPQKY